MKSTPKVLHVIRSEAFGGLELYVDTLIKKLKDTGLDMAVYCMPNAIIANKLSNEGIKIIAGKKNTKYSFQDIINIRKLVLKEDYTIVHSHTNIDAWSCAIALMGLRNCKHIFSLYMSTIPKRDLFHWFIYRKIDLLLSTSEQTNSKVELNYPIHVQKIKLLRYGRDVGVYNRNADGRNTIRRQWNVDETQIVIGTMCRIDPTKGIKDLAEAFLYLPEDIKEKVVFWIVGERTILSKNEHNIILYEKESDELYYWLTHFIAHNKLEASIRIIPFQKDLQGYLSAMDIFVLASWNEMYALAVLDALLMELPVIGTDIGGTPEQLANNRGLTVQPQNPQKLANAIEYLINNPTLAKEMGAKGRIWVRQQHDWNNVLPQYLALYQPL